MIHDRHKNQLLESGIDPTQAEIDGWRSISDADARALGFVVASDRAACLNGLYIPYFDPHKGTLTSFGRIRLDTPVLHGGSRAAKYLQPPSTGSRLFFPMFVDRIARGFYGQHLASSSVAGRRLPIFFVEGEKKALSLALRVRTRGVVIGLGGVENWSRKKSSGLGEERELLEDFTGINLSARKVYIIYDSDVISNPNVFRAEEKFAKALRSRGARVHLCTLMPGPYGEKVGLDDFLAQAGETWEDSFRAMLRRAIKKERKPRPRVYTMEEMLATTFRGVDLLMSKKEGKMELPLLNTGGLLYIHAASGVGKTFFALQLAHALATGTEMIGFQPAAQFRVLFMQAELNDAWFKRRLSMLERDKGKAKELFIMNGQLTLAWRDSEHYNRLECNLLDMYRLQEEYRPVAVVLDPLQAYMDIPENDTDANRKLMQNLYRLRRRHNVAFIITHHDRKAREGERMHLMRGSSVLTDWADTVLSLTPDKSIYKPRGETTPREHVWPDSMMLNVDKMRHAEGPKPEWIRLKREEGTDEFYRPWFKVHPEQDNYHRPHPDKVKDDEPEKSFYERDEEEPE